ncbi:hypothetical protein JHW43_000463 [Diplocarpon mali]|nr:hypothetical protein JHW43_000463 [Diplocarpon mali]
MQSRRSLSPSRATSVAAVGFPCVVIVDSGKYGSTNCPPWRSESAGFIRSSQPIEEASSIPVHGTSELQRNECVLVLDTIQTRGHDIAGEAERDAAGATALIPLSCLVRMEKGKQVEEFRFGGSGSGGRIGMVHADAHPSRNTTTIRSDSFTITGFSIGNRRPHSYVEHLAFTPSFTGHGQYQ